MSSASSLYQSVINDVISSVRESFLDESVDETVLQELRNMWQSKLEASKAVETPGQYNNDSAALGMLSKFGDINKKYFFFIEF